MKKLLCVLLVLSFLVPLACAHADNAWSYVGTWVYYEESESTGDLWLEIMHLNK